MKLYLVKQNINTGYDTYDSFICAANSEDEAKRMNPGGFRKWSDSKNCWMFQYVDGTEEPDDDSSWVNHIKNVKVKEIGKAIKGIKSGIICASFNAG